MNVMNLRIIGALRGDTFVTVDGARVENGNCTIQTEKTQVRVAVCRYIDAGGPLWFIVQLFLFIVSIFGIFDVRGRGKYLVADCQMDIYLKQSCDLTIKINPPKKNAKVAEFNGDIWLAEWSNKYVADESAKKKYFALNLTKLFLALAALATLIICLVVLL
ncbi:MAG: hypothetical protein K2J61_00615 [Clostridia bacterium]|nr:hypothetical protein [Clostridia bacterium]